MRKHSKKPIPMAKEGEDLEPTKYGVWRWWGLMCREEMAFYPALSEKTDRSSRWTNAINDENMFDGDEFSGFMGLEVFHGMRWGAYCED